MKILCIVMTILFLLFAVMSTIGCFLEWSGKCSTCDHGEQCNVTIRARLYSCFMTIILWVCGATWCWLTWQAYADDRHDWSEEKVKNLKTNYRENMKNSYERKH
jgi:hypothetical protein